MGKTKQSGKSGTKGMRSVPLMQQIVEDGSVKPTVRQKKRKREEQDDTVVDDKISKKILKVVERQREELDESDKVTVGSYLKSRNVESDEESEEDARQKSDVEDDDNLEDADGAMLSEFTKFANCDSSYLVSVVKDKETEIMTECSDITGIRPHAVIDPSMKQSCVALGEFLKMYRSGKLPKFFKTIPHLKAWEDFVELMKPEEWSSAAMREATKMFISNFKEGQAVKFLRSYLLPRVRDAIASYKRLDPHLFEAVNRSLFKAGAFMEGFLVPLCESGTCTLQEATIISGVLKKVSIKMTYSAAALLALIRLPYSGATMLIMQALLEKKYSLPLTVIQSLADYFIGFLDNDTEFSATVIWHQGLLTFAQLCKTDVDEDRKQKLLELIKVHRHHEISDEIRRELVAQSV